MAFESVELRDDFNRANEGPPPSANWTVLTGIGEDPGVGLLVLANEVALSGTGFRRGGAFWNGHDFVHCEVVVKVAVASPEDIHLYARLVDIGATTTDGYELHIDGVPAPDSWELARRDNTTPTVLASSTQNIAAGDRIALRVIGAELEGWHEVAGVWTRKLRATDTTYSAAGKAGIAIAETNQVARIDDFRAGEVMQPIAVPATFPPTRFGPF